MSINEKTQLVQVKNNEAYTSSKIIADMLEVEHRDLMRTIEKVLKRQKNNALTSAVKFPQKFKESTFKNRMGRNFKSYFI